MARRAGKTRRAGSQRKPPTRGSKGLSEWGIGPRAHPGPARMPPSSPSSRPAPMQGFPSACCPRLPRRTSHWERQPRDPARTDLQHRHRAARAGRHRRHRPDPLARTHPALQHLRRRTGARARTST
ncbi:MAG: hypothetical protein MZV64_17905 [Ignavibacteriales bacterium]|nr:hypothetical protein [Ignavibacteriales bacterium]